MAARPCDDRAVSAITPDRALTIFEAFLRHARGLEEPDAPPSPAELDNEVTHVAPAPTRPAKPVAQAAPTPAPPAWDDHTEESHRPSPAAVPEERTDLSVKLPPAPAHLVVEQSIIIDDDSLTSPEMSRAEALGVAPSIAAHAQNALDTLLQEMAVLVKYGHSSQAAQELELWATSHPDDLTGHLRVAEFEMARVDRELALQRYGTLVSLFLDRGDTRSADDVLRRLRRDMPGDPRVTAIAQWNGLT